MIYRSTKTYSHDRGLSVAFRQWRAASHCHLIHGYALAIKLTFEADELDECGWVMDFGGLKDIKAWIDRTFDHTTLVAADDPQLEWFADACSRRLMNVIIVHATGCEGFARLIFDHVGSWLNDKGYRPRVRLAQVEVMEHGANSAIVVEEAE